MTDITIRRLAEESRPSAEAVLSRSEAEAHDVHAYALKEIAVLEAMILRLKENIIAKKAQREQASRDYIEAVDETLRACRVMEEPIARLTAAVDKA